MIVDLCPVNLRALHAAGGADDHVHHDGQAILTGVQRGEVGRELLGQHREDFGRRIDRGGVLTRVRVDGGAGCHQCVHVRDGHADSDRVAGEGVGDRQLIQITGVVVVEGRPRQVPQVAYFRGEGSTARDGRRLHRAKFGRHRR
jgi:hypothetical protein